MSAEFYYQSVKYREAELVRAAEQRRLVDEALRAAKAERAEARTEQEKGGAARSHSWGVGRLRRASSPSAC